MKKVLWHIAIAFFGAVGVFIGILPDLYPDLVSQWPTFKNMDKGFEILNNFKETKSEGKVFNVSELIYGDKGFEEIYDILMSIDRSGKAKDVDILYKQYKSIKKKYPVVKKIPRPSIYAVVDNTFKWGSKSLFVGVFIEGGGSSPICMMPELAFLIRDTKIRFFSRWGFGFAFVAIISQFFYAIWGIRKSNSIEKTKATIVKKINPKKILFE